MRRLLCATAWVIVAATGAGRSQTTALPRTAVVALTHVKLIDGTGEPAKDDQTVVIDRGRVRAVGPSKAAITVADAEVLDLHGRTVIPGLIGMHDHLFYQLEPGASEMVVPAQSAFAKLYLAAGVTTIRTAGTVDFSGDARIKARIDAGKEPGPKIYLTGPYLDARTSAPDPDGIAKLVDEYANAGATSIKAYTSLRASELKAAITAAHARGMRVTGHLCAVGFKEAASLGIDNVEHGIGFDTDLYSEKRPDVCPDQGAVFSEVARLDVGDSDIRQAIGELIRHNVAVTSTLAIIESLVGDDDAFDPRVPPLLTWRLRSTYERSADRVKNRHPGWKPIFARLLRVEMAFERAFVGAGGKLLAGVDPTGWGGVVAGFGDHREVELLVEAGFTPEKAVEIATWNGASFLYDRHVGTVEPGRQADLVVVRGDLVKNIADIRHVEMVFKDGVAYDPEPLIAAAQGSIGAFEMADLFTWRSLGIMGVVAALVGNRARRWRRRTPAAQAV